MSTFPTGTVTFVFAEIGGSGRTFTRLDHQRTGVLDEYRRLLRTAFVNGGGQAIEVGASTVLVMFRRAEEAVAAAVATQRAVAVQGRFKRRPLSVRMGVQTGAIAVAGGPLQSPAAHPARRICVAGHGGEILISESTRFLVEEDLPAGVTLRHLGAHRLTDLQRVEHLFQVVHPDLPADFPPPRSLDTLPNNLPLQLTSFVGREREIAEVNRLLKTTRLLTLTGAGGCGKTRLALQVAADALDEYRDGVWMVELAALSDPDLVPQAIVSALGVPEQPGRPLTDTLATSLRSKALLLIFDNCEHLLPGCVPQIDTLLRAFPDLRLLATSREPLRVSGETRWRVPSLSLPDLDHLPAVQDLPQFEAVRLFSERATAAWPAFEITSQNLSALVQVCHQLDGIPLAIELAAARVNMLTLEQMALRLTDRFRFLRDGSRAVLPRHQTLRAAMDWSYELLSEQERALWRRLSVFGGSWTLEAAEAICAEHETGETTVLSLLAQLVDKSLVAVEMDAREARYHLLETVRQYGWDRLEEAGETAQARTRHRDWYLQLAEQADRELRGPGLEAWLKRLEAEHDNLIAALEWSRMDSNGAEAEVRLAAALRWFWFIHGHWTEGRVWLERALSRRHEVPPAVLPRALHGAATLARFQGDHESAVALCEDGLALSRELGDKEGIAWFLIWLGAAALHQGDYARATARFEEGVALSRDLADRWLMSMAFTDLGVVARLQGDTERAAALHSQGLALGREVGDKWRIAFSLSSLATVELQRGDHGRATALHRESLTLCRDMGDRWITHDSLEGLAGAACAQGHYQRAARLLGAADALREILGFFPLAPDRAGHLERLDATRAGLGEAAFAAAWGEGRAMPLEHAVEYALDPSDPARPQHAGPPPLTIGRLVNLLSPREREVASLIAQGHSSREIAALLVISERTAETHVQHMLTKLGFKSRAQIAAWAIEHELHTVVPPGG